MTGENSGRVTTKTFYEALLEQNKEAAHREQRIIDRINDGITAQQEYQQGADAKFAADYVRLGNLEKKTDSLEKWDKRLGILTIVTSGIASFLGISIER